MSLVLFQIGTNLPSLLDQNTQGQPFILILGNPEQPEQAFVVVEKNVVLCKSLLQAVDVCFKVVYVLDINYAWQCQHTWDFIQKFFYSTWRRKGQRYINTNCKNVYKLPSKTEHLDFIQT